MRHVHKPPGIQGSRIAPWPGPGNKGTWFSDEAYTPLNTAFGSEHVSNFAHRIPLAAMGMLISGGYL